MNMKAILPVLLSCSLLMPVAIEAQNSQAAPDLVQQVIHNELQADDQDHSKWTYLSRKRLGHTTNTYLIADSTDGDISELVAAGGHPLSPEQREQEQKRIAELVNDPAKLARARKRGEEDSRKARQLMKIIPQAFVFQYAGRQDRNIKIAFQPDPQFNPSTREAEVLHAMEGIMVVDGREKRFVSLSGQMVRQVRFGFGLLGRLNKGGTFMLNRQEEAPGHWKTTLIDVHLKGKALLFKTISEQQHEVHWRFRPLPEGFTAKQAATLLNNEAPAVEVH